MTSELGRKRIPAWRLIDARQEMGGFIASQFFTGPDYDILLSVSASEEEHRSVTISRYVPTAKFHPLPQNYVAGALVRQMDESLPAFNSKWMKKHGSRHHEREK